MNTIPLEHTYLLQVYARPDFVLDHGEGCRVTDTEGREYIDCVAGIAVNALGYGDPDLQRALIEQSGKLWHVSNLYHSAPQARLAQLLCETSFADRVHFANCGASANESAFKFARRYARERARSVPPSLRDASQGGCAQTGPSTMGFDKDPHRRLYRRLSWPAVWLTGCDRPSEVSAALRAVDAGRALRPFQRPGLGG